MGEKIIVIREDENGMLKDTIINHQDTIKIKLGGTQTLELPEERIEVETPGKDGFDYTIAIVTLAGVVFTLVYTFLSIKKLFKKDEQKETQIAKLAGIAAELKLANEQALKRDKLSRRPFIDYSINPVIPNNAGGSVILDISNSNPISNIMNYDLLDTNTLGFNNYIKIVPGNTGNHQIMGVKFFYSGHPAQGGIFSIVYTTEQGYEYIQEINLAYDATSNSYKARGLQVVLRENAAG